MDIRLTDWCCSASMLLVQILLREKLVKWSSIHSITLLPKLLDEEMTEKYVFRMHDSFPCVRTK
jgi:hypothetical protein